MRGIEILDRGDLKAVLCGALHDIAQVILLPELRGIASPPPPRQVARRLVLGHVGPALIEVIHAMAHQPLAAGLGGKLEMLVVELVAVKPEAEFHGGEMAYWLLLIAYGSCPDPDCLCAFCASCGHALVRIRDIREIRG